MQEGAIRIMTAADFSPTTPQIREALLHTSPKTQKVANERMEQILIYAQGGLQLVSVFMDKCVIL
jgi:hypothetical protein